MTNKIKNTEQFKRLTNALVKDIIELSDEEILAEANEKFDDPTVEITRLRGLINNALLKASKAKLVEAKMQVANHNQKNTANNVIPLTTLQKKLIIERFTNQDCDLQQKLTLAARKGEGIQTENDIEGMFEDMIELGIIDNQGHQK